MILWTLRFCTSGTFFRVSYVVRTSFRMIQCWISRESRLKYHCREIWWACLVSVYTWLQLLYCDIWFNVARWRLFMNYCKYGLTAILTIIPILWLQIDSWARLAQCRSTVQIWLYCSVHGSGILLADMMNKRVLVLPAELSNKTACSANIANPPAAHPGITISTPLRLHHNKPEHQIQCSGGNAVT